MSHANTLCSVNIEVMVLFQALVYVLVQAKFLLGKALQRYGPNRIYIHDCTDR